MNGEPSTIYDNQACNYSTFPDWLVTRAYYPPSGILIISLAFAVYKA